MDALPARPSFLIVKQEPLGPPLDTPPASTAPNGPLLTVKLEKLDSLSPTTPSSPNPSPGQLLPPQANQTTSPGMQADRVLRPSVEELLEPQIETPGKTAVLPPECHSPQYEKLDTSGEAPSMPLIRPAEAGSNPLECGPDTPGPSTPPPKLDQLAEQVRRTGEMLARLQNMVRGARPGGGEFTATEAAQPPVPVLDSVLSSQPVTSAPGVGVISRVAGAGVAVESRKRLFEGEVERGLDSQTEGGAVKQRGVSEKGLSGIVEAADVLKEAPEGQGRALNTISRTF